MADTTPGARWSNQAVVSRLRLRARCRRVGCWSDEEPADTDVPIGRTVTGNPASSKIARRMRPTGVRLGQVVGAGQIELGESEEHLGDVPSAGRQPTDRRRHEVRRSVRPAAWSSRIGRPPRRPRRSGGSDDVVDRAASSPAALLRPYAPAGRLIDSTYQPSLDPSNT